MSDAVIPRQFEMTVEREIEADVGNRRLNDRLRGDTGRNKSVDVNRDGHHWIVIFGLVTASLGALSQAIKGGAHWPLILPSPYYAVEALVALIAAARVLVRRSDSRIWFLGWWTVFSIREVLESYSVLAPPPGGRWELWRASDPLSVFMAPASSGVGPFVLVLLGIGSGALLLRHQSRAVLGTPVATALATAVFVYWLLGFVVRHRLGSANVEMVIWGSIALFAVVTPLLAQFFPAIGSDPSRLAAAAAFTFGLGSSVHGSRIAGIAAESMAVIVVALCLQLSAAALLAGFRGGPISWKATGGNLLVALGTGWVTARFVAAFLLSD